MLGSNDGMQVGGQDKRYYSKYEDSTVETILKGPDIH